MIWNIIDKRTRTYRWKAITAIIEPVSHDNSCADSDQADESEEESSLTTIEPKSVWPTLLSGHSRSPSRLRYILTTLAMASGRLTFDKPRASL